MKKLLVFAVTACLLTSPDTSSAVAAERSIGFLHMAAQCDRKEARKLRKENRKARREAFKSRNGAGAAKSDYNRIMKENYKQRKKMERASRKENRSNWGTNQSGDVFNVF